MFFRVTVCIHYTLPSTTSAIMRMHGNAQHVCTLGRSKLCSYLLLFVDQSLCLLLEWRLCSLQSHFPFDDICENFFFRKVEVGAAKISSSVALLVTCKLSKHLYCMLSKLHNQPILSDKLWLFIADSSGGSISQL